MQNAGLATVLAVRHFPAMPEAVIASAVSCVWHSVSGALLAGIFNSLDGMIGRREESDSLDAECENPRRRIEKRL